LGHSANTAAATMPTLVSTSRRPRANTSPIVATDSTTLVVTATPKADTSLGQSPASQISAPSASG
jgi:hypothetical protein